MILWSLILAVVVLAGLAIIGDNIESRKHQKRMSELSTIVESKPYINNTNKDAVVSELRSKGYTDYEIYIAFEKSPYIKESFEKAKIEGGYTDSDIAKHYGLDIFK